MCNCMNIKWMLCCCLGFLLAGGMAGFFAGRRFSEKTETIKYVREPAVTGTVTPLNPVKVEVPDIAWLPTRTDTVYVDQVMYARQVVDTAAIIADYELKRSYAMPLFDNNYGKLSLSLSTQYNRLGEVSYEFIPITKIVYRERTWRPFVDVSYSTFGYVGGGAGIFYKSTGIGIQYQTDFKRNGLGIRLVKTF